MRNKYKIKYLQHAGEKIKIKEKNKRETMITHTWNADVKSTIAIHVFLGIEHDRTQDSYDGEHEHEPQKQLCQRQRYAGHKIAKPFRAEAELEDAHDSGNTQQTDNIQRR